MLPLRQPSLCARFKIMQASCGCFGHSAKNDNASKYLMMMGKKSRQRSWITCDLGLPAYSFSRCCWSYRRGGVYTHTLGTCARSRRGKVTEMFALLVYWPHSLEYLLLEASFHTSGIDIRTILTSSFKVLGGRQLCRFSYTTSLYVFTIQSFFFWVLSHVWIFCGSAFWEEGSRGFPFW